MSKPLVSIILINFNGKNYTVDCIKSVLKSDYPNFEIIVVDNASTEGDYQYFKKKFAKNQKVKLFHSPIQLHFTGGNNLGAQKAKGKYLIMLNNDATVDKNWIKYLIDFIKDHPKWVIQPKVLCFQKPKIIDNAGGKYNLIGMGIGIGMGQTDGNKYNKPYRIDFAKGTVFMLRKNFYDQLGGLDEWFKTHYEDVDLALRAKKKGGQCWYCPDAIVYHKGSLTIKKKRKKEYVVINIRKNRLRTILKNFTGLERLTRLILITPVLLGLVIKDLFEANERRTMTLQALGQVINKQIKDKINIIRIKEIKTIIKKNTFSLCDLGCGDGSFIYLAKKQGIETIGIDKIVVNNPTIIKKRVEDFKINKKFDVVTMYHVVEHSLLPEVFMKKAKEITKNKGVIVIETPLVDNESTKLLGQKYFAYLDPDHKNLFSKKYFYEFLESQKLEIIHRSNKTKLIFPFHSLTTGLKMNFPTKLKSLNNFIQGKIFRFNKVNQEIIRVYCSKI